MRWLELLLLGETSEIRRQWWWCYSQLVFQVWVSQSGAESLQESVLKRKTPSMILRHSTNSPSAWGFSFFTMSVLSVHPVLHVSRCNDAQRLPFSLLPERPHKPGTQTCLSLPQRRIHLSIYPWKSDTPHRVFFSYSPSSVLANLSLLSPVSHWGHDVMRWHAMTVTLMLCSATLVMAWKDRHPHF